MRKIKYNYNALDIQKRCDDKVGKNYVNYLLTYKAATSRLD